MLAAVVALESAAWAIGVREPSDFTWAGLLVTCLVAWCGLEAGRPRLPSSAFLVAMVLLDLLSTVRGWYSDVWMWDKAMHCAGGACIAVTVAAWLQHRGASGRLVPFGCVAAAALVGYGYEVLEYLVDASGPPGQPSSLVSAWDVVEDQGCNLLGAIGVVSVMCCWRGAAHRGIPAVRLPCRWRL